MGLTFVLAVAAIVIYVGWRGARRQHDRVVEALRQAEAAVRRDTPVTLEKDPRTGVYRPKQ
ncbi:MAG TPA: hypothetical protein VFB16_09695 [Bauldia sp.]|nr:hypothetical protein [Bauldia sp.]